ncbi:hypothetical protein V6N11_047760 [Hibiscus sabdariffa]|uniref:Secreted protein n=1 Tax=Hibiscus sabdariffa TaxID=183260 RepID=A0ABR2P7W0_9ROSI
MPRFVVFLFFRPPPSSIRGTDIGSELRGSRGAKPWWLIVRSLPSKLRLKLRLLHSVLHRFGLRTAYTCRRGETSSHLRSSSNWSAQPLNLSPMPDGPAG